MVAAAGVSVLRPAERSEATALSELCLRSKAVWGYDEAFLEACADELSIVPEEVNTETMQVAELGGELAGFVEIALNGPEGTVEKLFVEPATWKREWGGPFSSGRRSKFGIRTLVVEADPGAAPFYLKMGGVADGSVLSGSIPSRTLPRFRLDLTKPARGEAR